MTSLRIATLLIGTVMWVGTVNAENCENVTGITGSTAAQDWQSSWIDFKSPMDFRAGETLKIQIMGSAANVLVRLLPDTSRPDSPDGIEGGVRSVPKDAFLRVKLQRNHSKIKQVSVHGRRIAWHTSLGGNNGDAVLVSLQRCTP